jgi:hypothetical protein
MPRAARKAGVSAAIDGPVTAAGDEAGPPADGERGGGSLAPGADPAAPAKGTRRSSARRQARRTTTTPTRALA